MTAVDPSALVDLELRDEGAANASLAVSSNGHPEAEPSASGELFGASGKAYHAEKPAWQMPTPTTVSSVRDGHPSGRHMIDGYRMMGAAARVSGGKYQHEMAEVYEMAALCIENEAARADRAEALLVALGSNSAPRAPAPAPETPTPADAARSAHRDSSNVTDPGLYSASNRPHGEV